MSYGTPSPFDVPHSGYVRQRPRGMSCLTMALIFFGGSALLLVLICAGAAVTLSRPPQASPSASEPFTYEEGPVPDFPERVAAEGIGRGVLKRGGSLGGSDGFYSPPRHGGKIGVLVAIGKA